MPTPLVLKRTLSQCAAFVGGLPVHADTARLRCSSCQVVVGTPGRLRALIQDGSLQTEHLRLLVRRSWPLCGGIVRDMLCRCLMKQIHCLRAASSTTLPLYMVFCRPGSRFVCTRR